MAQQQQELYSKHLLLEVECVEREGGEVGGKKSGTLHCFTLILFQLKWILYYVFAISLSISMEYNGLGVATQTTQ